MLARARLADQQAGASEAEAGWTDGHELARMLGVTPEKLNIDVLRARKLLAEQGVVEAARVVERRPRTRQLRLGIRRIRLAPL